MVQSNIPIPCRQMTKHFIPLHTLVWWEQLQSDKRNKRWNFSEGIVHLETIFCHLEINLDHKSDPQCNASRSHVYPYTFYLPQMWAKPIFHRVKIGQLRSHASSPRSYHSSSVWSKLFKNEHLQIYL